MNIILFPYIHIFTIFLKVTSISAASPPPDWMLNGMEATVRCRYCSAWPLLWLPARRKPHIPDTIHSHFWWTLPGGSKVSLCWSDSMAALQQALPAHRGGPCPAYLVSTSRYRGLKEVVWGSGFSKQKAASFWKAVEAMVLWVPPAKKKHLLLMLSLLHQPILHTEGTHTALQAALQPSSRWWDRTAVAGLHWASSGLQAASELLLVHKTTAWILNSLPVSGFHLPACPEQWSTCWPFICMCSSNYQRRKYKRQIMRSSP